MSTTKTYTDIAATAGVFGIAFGIIYIFLLGYRVLFTNDNLSEVTANATFMFVSFALYTFAVIFLIYSEIWSNPGTTGLVSIALNILYLVFGVLPLSYLFLTRIGDRPFIIIFRFLFLLLPFLAHSYVSFRYIRDNYLVDVEPPANLDE